MKKILIFISVFFIFKINAQGKRFFESGKAELKNKVETINLNYFNELPLIKVKIEGKMYQFIFDTGAPTVISTKIYEELMLKKKYKRKITDSQKNRQEQILTVIPEMKVDEITFKNIGAAVINLEGTEFSCMKIDGIVGANQMAKLFWRVNYSENLIEATKDFSQFSTEGYETVFSFKPKPQKTPHLESEIFGKKINLTFDTGFTGSIKISDNSYDPKNSGAKFIESYGNVSVGAFGTAKPQTTYYIRAGEILLDNKKFENEIILTGYSNLLGNEFLKKFKFIMDWENNKIYLHRISNEPVTINSFGFAYRFIDHKAKVALVFQGKDNPMKFGDEILSINNTSLENLNDESVCKYFLNRLERNSDSIEVKVKRGEDILNFSLTKKEYLK